MGQSVHTNLFSLGHSRSEVYAALLEHQERDTRIHRWLNTGAFLSLFGTLIHWPNEKFVPLWGIGFAFFALSSLRYFMDMSNRNFMLHLIEWEQSSPDDLR